MTWWGTDNATTDLLRQEIEAMRQLFNTRNKVLVDQTSIGGFPYYVETLAKKLNTDDPDNIFWEITFRMHETSRWSKISTDEHFTIKIKYNSRFPVSPPDVSVTSHQFSSFTPHYYSGDNTLCLYHGVSRHDGWNPVESTAASLGAWTTQWLRAYLIWKKTTRWPEPN